LIEGDGVAFEFIFEITRHAVIMPENFMLQSLA
jgi:hypothetical protein